MVEFFIRYFYRLLNLWFFLIFVFNLKQKIR